MSDSQAGKITKPDKFGVSRQRASGTSQVPNGQIACEGFCPSHLTRSCLHFGAEFKDYIDGQPEQLKPSSIPT
jgi:hypothetical protein